MPSPTGHVPPDVAPCCGKNANVARVIDHANGGHHGKGSDATEQGKEEAQSRAQQEEERRSAAVAVRGTGPGQAGRKSVRQERLRRLPLVAAVAFVPRAARMIGVQPWRG